MKVGKTKGGSGELVREERKGEKVREGERVAKWVRREGSSYLCKDFDITNM